MPWEWKTKDWLVMLRRWNMIYASNGNYTISKPREDSEGVRHKMKIKNLQPSGERWEASQHLESKLSQCWKERKLGPIRNCQMIDGCMRARTMNTNWARSASMVTIILRLPWLKANAWRAMQEIRQGVGGILCVVLVGSWNHRGWQHKTSRTGTTHYFSWKERLSWGRHWTKRGQCWED